jgi:hypothetical protein
MENFFTTLKLIPGSVCDSLKSQFIYLQINDVRHRQCSGLENIADARQIFGSLSGEEKQILSHFVAENNFDGFFIKGGEVIFANHIIALNSLVDKGLITMSGANLDIFSIKPIIVEVTKKNLQIK